MDRIYSDSPHPQPFHHHCLCMQAVCYLVIGGHGKVCFQLETLYKLCDLHFVFLDYSRSEAFGYHTPHKMTQIAQKHALDMFCGVS